MLSPLDMVGRIGTITCDPKSVHISGGDCLFFPKKLGLHSRKGTLFTFEHG